MNAHLYLRVLSLYNELMVSGTFSADGLKNLLRDLIDDYKKPTPLPDTPVRQRFSPNLKRDPEDGEQADPLPEMITDPNGDYVTNDAYWDSPIAERVYPVLPTHEVTEGPPAVPPEDEKVYDEIATNYVKDVSQKPYYNLGMKVESAPAHIKATCEGITRMKMALINLNEPYLYNDYQGGWRELGDRIVANIIDLDLAARERMNEEEEAGALDFFINYCYEVGNRKPSNKQFIAFETAELIKSLNVWKRRLRLRGPITLEELDEGLSKASSLASTVKACCDDYFLQGVRFAEIKHGVTK